MEEWWADSVKEVYRESLAALGGDEEPLKDGPGHIAWADGNFADEEIHWCLEEAGGNRDVYAGRFGPAAVAVVRRSLERLLEIPEAVRDCDPYEPDDD